MTDTTTDTFTTTCADCGVDHFRDEPCGYCYELAEVVAVVATHGRKVHFKGHADSTLTGDLENRARRVADNLNAASGRTVAKVVTETRWITRCEHHEYDAADDAAAVVTVGQVADDSLPMPEGVKWVGTRMLVLEA